jgi:glycosyltransferase involved in cell wall biosynthesis
LKVAYLILNSFDVDSRARMEVETIVRMGHQVDIVVTVGAETSEYLGFPIHRIAQLTWPSRKIRFVQYNLKAALLGMKLKADIYHAVDVDTLAAAFWAARKTGGKVIYEARELYTELEPLRGRAMVRSFWGNLEKRLIGRVARVVTINDSIADELCRRYQIKKPDVIRNVARTPDNIHPVDLRANFGIPGDHKIIVYQGVLRHGQGLLNQLDILPYLDRVVMMFIGDGPIELALREKASSLNIDDRVVFAGRVDPDELMNYTVSADAGILLMEDIALNNRLALPQKLFQYLSAGIPQIVSPMPEISRFVREEKTGVVVPLEDPHGAAGTIAGLIFDENLYSAVKENCRESSARNNWEIESTKWVEIYKDLESSK